MSQREMRNYEIIMIINPEFFDRVGTIIDGYRNTIEKRGGEITRSEDWGRRKLAYRIGKHHKGHYVLLNFSCEDTRLVDDLQLSMDKDDPVLRSLVTRTSVPESDVSPIMHSKMDDKAEAEASS